MKLIDRRKRQIIDELLKIVEYSEMFKDGTVKIDTHLRLMELKEAADKAYALCKSYQDLLDVQKYGEDGGR